MPAFLFFEALFQLLHDFVPTAERFDLGLFLFGEEFLGQGLQPIFGNFGNLAVAEAFQPFENMAEHLVELVEIALILHQGGARQVIEILDLIVDDVTVQRLQERQIFAQGDRHIGRFQLVEKIDEHGPPLFG